MKGKRIFVRAALCASVVLFGVSAASAEKKADLSAYGDVVAKVGQSEVIVENPLPNAVNIVLDGRADARVEKGRSTRIVVADGNHNIKVVSNAKGNPASKDVQFYTKAKRFTFKVTSPTAQTVGLERISAYDLAIPPGGPAPGVSVANGGNEPPPLAETSLGKDKAAMFNRLDAQLGQSGASAPAAAPAPAPAPAQAQVSAAPSASASASVSAGGASATAVAGGAKFFTSDGKKPHIAVYVTSDKSDKKVNDVKTALGAKMLTALVNSGKFIAIERSKEFLDEIDNEQRKQREGAVDESQISKLGRQFGVHYVCIANITEALGSYQISARIINVETAVVVAMGEDDSPLRNMDDLAGVSFKVTKMLLKE